jgi:stage V sporulation protein D (sporulation-specific penicillin-binding protein)
MAKKQKQLEENVRIRSDSGHHRRILALMALLGIIGFIPAALRLYDLMVIDYDYYRDLALRNQSRVTSVAAQRGSIYDRNLTTLACGQSVENVYFNPRELRRAGENIEEISNFLGEVLGKDPDWIAEQAKDTALRYKQIASDVDQETAEQIRSYIVENDVAGIHLEPDTARYYPQGSLAAQVIGFTNDSGVGSEGVEAAYNSFLQGTAGKVIT